MVNIAKCETNPDVLSVSGMKAVQDIRDTIDNANLLAKIIAAVPLFSIFAGNGGFISVKNAGSYDWETFSAAMRGIPDRTRRIVEQISGTQSLQSQGKEQEFWRCVHEAVR